MSLGGCREKWLTLDPAFTSLWVKKKIEGK
jgi:hypothetical protein